VTLYIVDSGVQADHPELSPRVAAGADFTTPGGGVGRDCAGHGTAVASVAAGATAGVCPDCALVPVRVLNCNGAGPCSAAVLGLNWVREAVRARERGAATATTAAADGASPPTPSVGRSVVVLSVGSSLDVCFPTLASVAALDADGIVVVVAAGNANSDACTVYPAKSARALTVGAVDGAGRRWTESPTRGSNRGGCVDVYARGVNVAAAWGDGVTASTVRNGTSFAAPAVAGAAANLLRALPRLSPAAVRAVLVDAAVVADDGDGLPVATAGPLPRLVPAAAGAAATYSASAAALTDVRGGVVGGGDVLTVDVVVTPAAGAPDPPLRYAAVAAADAVRAAAAAAGGDGEPTAVAWALDTDGWSGGDAGGTAGGGGTGDDGAAPSGRYPLRLTLTVGRGGGARAARAVGDAHAAGRLFGGAAAAGLDAAGVTAARTGGPVVTFVDPGTPTPTPTPAAVVDGSAFNVSTGDGGSGGGGGGDGDGGTSAVPVIIGSVAGVAALLLLGVGVLWVAAARRREADVEDGGGGAGGGEAAADGAAMGPGGGLPSAASGDNALEGVVQTRAGTVNFGGGDMSTSTIDI